MGATMVGTVFCFVAMNRIALASGTHATIFLVQIKGSVVFNYYIAVIFVVTGIATARARGYLSRCEREEVDARNESSGQAGGKRSVAVTEAKL